MVYSSKLLATSLKKRISLPLVPILFLLLQTNCSKLIDVNPPKTSLTGASIFESDITASAVLTNIYTKMSSFGNIGTYNQSVSYLAGLSSDEFTLSSYRSIRDNAYYTNSLSSNIAGGEFWNSFYQYVFICNSAIEGLTSSKSLTPAVKQQLLGEAKFIRAFCYFYLVNLYGETALATTSDYKINSTLSRSSLHDVYQLMISDLLDAISLLNETYVKADAFSTYNPGAEERVRPNKSAAKSLLARVYLYNGDYSKAENMATEVINNNSLYQLTALNETFLKNSKEAIWQLQPISNTPSNTGDAYLFVIPPTGLGNDNPVHISNNLLNSFELGDQRRTHWIDSILIGNIFYYYPYKYKAFNITAPVSEYTMVLRLAEQYLIRAEARAQQNNLSGSQEDLNILRTRSGLESIQILDQTSILKSISHERQVEMFTEWGHRWLDIKRLPGNLNTAQSLADEIMPEITANKGGIWLSNWKLYPILFNDIQYNRNLKQNPGYN